MHFVKLDHILHSNLRAQVVEGIAEDVADALLGRTFFFTGIRIQFRALALVVVMFTFFLVLVVT